MSARAPNTATTLAGVKTPGGQDTRACTKTPHEQEILNSLVADDPKAIAELFKKAHSVRLANVGPTVHLRAIIEFSNYCRQDCLYCGLRKSNKRLKRYRMSPEEIIHAARMAMEVWPFGTFVLQSGEDPDYPVDAMCKAIREIKAMGAAVTLSLGQRAKKDYAIWREAGADRYLLKFETGDPVLFGKLKPTTTLEARLECLYNLRDLEYQVGSGIILGLPGQTALSVARDILLMAELDLGMVSIGPFIPHPDTPLGNISPLKPEDLVVYTLKAIALARLVVPLAHMPGTTALEVLSKNLTPGPFYCELGGNVRDARARALLSGANVIMVDLTPKEYRDAYDIYPGKSVPDWDLVSAVQTAQDLIHAVDMEIDPGRGDCLTAANRSRWNARKENERGT
jgi:biotin synthase